MKDIKKSSHVNVDFETKDRLQKYKDKTGMSMVRIIALSVDEYLKKRGF